MKDKAKFIALYAAPSWIAREDEKKEEDAPGEDKPYPENYAEEPVNEPPMRLVYGSPEMMARLAKKRGARMRAVYAAPDLPGPEAEIREVYAGPEMMDGPVTQEAPSPALLGAVMPAPADAWEPSAEPAAEPDKPAEPKRGRCFFARLFGKETKV
ncbi:MAG: hypothetical protein J5586_07655 [Clostridia bacterium]|nr:hypothetical protein [Clostridia bacterium]